MFLSKFVSGDIFNPLATGQVDNQYRSAKLFMEKVASLDGWDKEEHFVVNNVRKLALFTLNPNHHNWNDWERFDVTISYISAASLIKSFLEKHGNMTVLFELSGFKTKAWLRKDGQHRAHDVVGVIVKTLKGIQFKLYDPNPGRAASVSLGMIAMAKEMSDEEYVSIQVLAGDRKHDNVCFLESFKWMAGILDGQKLTKYVGCGYMFDVVSNRYYLPIEHEALMAKRQKGLTKRSKGPKVVAQLNCVTRSKQFQ